MGKPITNIVSKKKPIVRKTQNKTINKTKQNKIKNKTKQNKNKQTNKHIWKRKQIWLPWKLNLRMIVVVLFQMRFVTKLCTHFKYQEGVVYY